MIFSVGALFHFIFMYTNIYMYMYVICLDYQHLNIQLSYLLNNKLSFFILSVERVIFASIMTVKRVKTNFVTKQVTCSVRQVTMETNVKLTVTQPCLITVTAQQTGTSNAVKSLWEYILMSDWFQRIFLPTCTIPHTHSLLTKGIAIEFI